MARQYKNVYTILEKVRKGEIDSYYKDDDGLFGKINFYKKPDLVKPYMHYLDEKRIDTILQAYLNDKNQFKEIMTSFQRTKAYQSLEETQKYDLDKMIMIMNKKYSTFPKHLVKDIFKMYYYQIDKLEFEGRSDKNKGKYKFLEYANNPVSRVMTETSSLKSAIFARNIIGYYLFKLAMLELTDPKDCKKIEESLENGNDDFNDVNDLFKDNFETSQDKKQLEKVLQNASNLCKQMDSVMDDSAQEQMFDSVLDVKEGGSNAAKLSPNYIQEVQKELESVKFSMGSLKEKIKRLLDRSINYFSSKQIVKYEDLFNADDLAGLDEYHLLHPKLRKIFAEDVMIKDSKSVGKIDIYVDISGSMSSSCGVCNEKGEQIDKLDFCKAFIIKLMDLDLLNNVYVFNDRVKPSKADVITVAMMNTSGGTNINRVIESIEKNKVNALVITDAEDHCAIYSDKAFFVGVNGARFSSFNTAVLHEYVDRNQIVVFDGTTIFSVDKNGFVRC